MRHQTRAGDVHPSSRNHRIPAGREVRWEMSIGATGFEPATSSSQKSRRSALESGGNHDTAATLADAERFASRRQELQKIARKRGSHGAISVEFSRKLLELPTRESSAKSWHGGPASKRKHADVDFATIHLTNSLTAARKTRSTR
jgi:hypothetical protein